MYLITHVTTPISLAVLSDLIRIRIRKAPFFSNSEYLVMGYCAVIPDMFWPDSHGIYEIGMTFTHSLVFSFLAFSGILLLSWMFYKPRPFLLRAFLFWLASVTHLLWDVVSGGKMLLYPFSSEVLGKRIIPIGYWYAVDVLFLAVTAFLWIRVIKREKLRNDAIQF